MKPILFLVSLLFICSCATQRTLEEDRNNPAYHRGDYATPYAPGTPQANSAEGAVAGGILAIPQIAGYYKGNKVLKGSCLIKGKEDPLGHPCQMYVMVLTDLSEKEVARTNADDTGDFKFIGLKTGKYMIQVIPRGKHESIETTGPFVTGQNAVIVLNQ